MSSQNYQPANFACQAYYETQRWFATFYNYYNPLNYYLTYDNNQTNVSYNYPYQNTVNAVQTQLEQLNPVSLAQKAFKKSVVSLKSRKSVKKVKEVKESTQKISQNEKSATKKGVGKKLSFMNNNAFENPIYMSNEEIIHEENEEEAKAKIDLKKEVPTPHVETKNVKKIVYLGVYTVDPNTYVEKYGIKSKENQLEETQKKVCYLMN